MSEEYPLTLRQTDEARSDFAAIESDLQFVMGQLVRLPTRRDLAKAALGISLLRASGGAALRGGIARPQCAATTMTEVALPKPSP
jgi:hypothetical protein